MTSDASNLPKHVTTPVIEGPVAPPFNDPAAASLRGFGPLGLLAILLIVLTSVFKPLSGRIWMVMCAHAAFDLAAIAIIYWNLETTVAHLVFK
jgi:hypothetical protein